MRALALLASLLLTPSCSSNQLQDVAPALLSPGADTAREEIASHIGNALGGSVVLADDAFASSSQLVIERRVHRDPAGNRLPGRILEEPERFRLALHNGDCILLHLNSGRQWVLAESHCIPASPAGQRQ